MTIAVDEPPPPAGVTIDAPASVPAPPPGVRLDNVPSPPPGVTIDPPQQIGVTAKAVATPAPRSFLGKVGDAALGAIGVGIGGNPLANLATPGNSGIAGALKGFRDKPTPVAPKTHEQLFKEGSDDRYGAKQDEISRQISQGVVSDLTNSDAFNSLAPDQKQQVYRETLKHALPDNYTHRQMLLGLQEVPVDDYGVDFNKGSVASGFSSAVNAGARALGEISQQLDPRTEHDTLSVNPQAVKSNIAGRTVGGSAPVVAASLVNPIAGATIGAAQGSGGALAEARENNYTGGQTAALATERAAYNAILGLIPGEGAAGASVLKETGKAALKVGALNLTQSALEAEVKQNTGIQSDDTWSAVKKAAASGDNWAQMILFGAIHGAVTKLHSQPATETRTDAGGETIPNVGASEAIGGRESIKEPPPPQGVTVDNPTQGSVSNDPTQTPTETKPAVSNTAITPETIKESENANRIREDQGPPSPKGSPAQEGQNVSGENLQQRPQETSSDATAKPATSDEVTTYHRETSPKGLRDLLTPPRRLNAEAEPTYLASHPDIAMGQGENKGLKLEFSPDGIKATKASNKPSAAFAESQGLTEYVSHQTAGELNKALKAITLPKSLADSVKGATEPFSEAGGLKARLDALERKGWTKTDTKDGTRWEKPQAQSPPQVEHGPGAAGENDPHFAQELANNPAPEDAPKVIRAVASPAGNTSRVARIANLLGEGIKEKAASSSKSIKEAYTSVGDSFRKLAQQSFPALNRESTRVGDAAMALASAPDTKSFTLDSWLGHLQAIAKDHGVKWNDFKSKLGAVVSEDQLRGVRDQKAARGDADAGQVKTLIGTKELPTEDDYQAATKDPLIRDAVAYLNSSVEPTLGQFYKDSSKWNAVDSEGIPIEPPQRGKDLGLHMSLLGIRDEASANPSGGLPKGGGIKNTLEKHSPFEKSASGQSQDYEVDFDKILDNALSRSILPGKDADFAKSIVDEGAGVLGKSGDKPEIDGEKLIPLDRSFRNGEKLFVKPSILNEVKAAFNIDRAPDSKLRAIGGVLTKIQLASGVEAISHIVNTLPKLIMEPTKGGILAELGDRISPKFGTTVRIAENFPVAKLIGVADSVGTKLFRTAFRDLSQKDTLASLADMGVVQGNHGGNKFNPITWTSKGVKAVTNAARISLSDSFDLLAKAGIVKDTTQNKRDYINQLGQYHQQAQAGVVRIMRDLGVSPYATAGTAQYANSLRMLAGFDSGLRTEGSLPVRVAKQGLLRANSIAQVGGLLAAAAVINYARTGKITPTGMPWGSLFLYYDKDGHPIYEDVPELLGVRRALRIVGADSALKGIAEGKRTGDIEKDALRQGVSSLVSPFMGPGPTAAIEGLTGYNPHGLYRITPDSGKLDIAANAEAAVKNLNPTIAAANGSDGIVGQLGKIAPRTGKNQVELDSTAEPKKKDDLSTLYRTSPAQAEKAMTSDKALSPSDKASIRERGKFKSEDAYKIAKGTAEDAIKSIEQLPPGQWKTSPYIHGSESYADIARAKISKATSLTPIERVQLLKRLADLRKK